MAYAARQPMLFGNEALEAVTAKDLQGQATAFPFVAQQTGTVSALSVYVDARSHATKLMAAVYSDRHSQPASRLASGATSLVKTGSWSMVRIPAVSVTRGEMYWVALLGRGGTLMLRDRRSGQCRASMSAQRNLRSLPASWRTGRSMRACPVSAYAMGSVAKTATVASDPNPTSDSGLPIDGSDPIGGTTPTLPIDPPTDPTSLLAPQNTQAPAIAGNTVQGSTLTVSNGTWNNTLLPTTYTYQWQDCNSSGTCYSISGATNQTYTLTAGDVGSTVQAVVTATNLGGSGTATSIAVGPVTSPPPSIQSAPSVSGTATQGDTLTTTNGTWSNSPTSYGYQWQDCNSSGASCSNISGATSHTYALTAGDVGHTVRAVVTASNAGGSASANSNTTAVVSSSTPAAPVNQTAPSVSGTATQGQTLTTTNGTWSNSPTSYGYQWQDCNSSGASCSNISGATSHTYALTAGDVGHTVRAVVTASNAGGSASANSNTTAVVSALTVAPVNQSVPTVSGTATQGQTLTTTNGTWSNSPTSYGYQWQDCNSSGASCSNISGATSQSYTLAAGDVNDTVRAVVTASNSAGSASADSSPTAVVAAAEGQTLNCFASPSACGYPDAAAGNVGVANCSSLPSWNPTDLSSSDYSASGSQITITQPNVTVSGYNIGNYFFYIEASHFTLNNDCISYNGSSWSGGQDSATSVWGDNSASNLTVENSTIVAQGCSSVENTVCSSSGVNESLITSGGASNATIENNILAGAVEPINGIGTGSLVESNYVLANGMVNGAHSEDIYEADTTGITITHNTLLNPMDQSAVIYGDVLNHGACDNGFTITNNLMGGGGYILLSCAQASSAGSSTLNFSDNDIARCGGTSNYDSSLGGHYCGSTAPSNSAGTAVGAGADSHGYWPEGGFFGLGEDIYCPPTAGVTWSGNTWDDTGASVACPS